MVFHGMSVGGGGRVSTFHLIEKIRKSKKIQKRFELVERKKVRFTDRRGEFGYGGLKSRKREMLSN